MSKPRLKMILALVVLVAGVGIAGVAIGGQRPIPWRVVTHYSWDTLIEEAHAMDRCAGCHETVLPGTGSQSNSVPTVNGPTRTVVSPRLLASAGRQRSFRCCQLLAKVLCQTTNRGDLRGTDPHSGLGFDPGPQFQVPQRIHTVLTQRPVGIDGAPQQQADLIRDQPPDHARPLVLRCRSR